MESQYRRKLLNESQNMGLNKKIKHSFMYILFAKPSCDNVMQHIITRGLGRL